MGTTISIPASLSGSSDAASVVIQKRLRWEDDWKVDTDLEMVGATAKTGSQDLGSCELRRRYGRTKQPLETAKSTRKSWNLIGWWVRLQIVGEQGALITIWVGKIASESRDPHAGEVLDENGNAVKSGEQRWIAYEPLQELRRLTLYQSWHRVNVDGVWAEHLSDRMYDMNARDAGGLVAGNRTAELSTNEDYVESYLFGRTSIWSRHDFLEYIINRFVQQYDDNRDLAGPVWMLGGQELLLDDIEDAIRLPAAPTVADILRLLIPTQMGIDFKIVYFEAEDDGDAIEGFTIHVYALLSKPQVFAGATLPANANPPVEVHRSSEQGMVQVRLDWGTAHRHDRIVVMGRPAVVCLSLEGESHAVGDEMTSLVPKWTAMLEGLYKGMEDEFRAGGRFEQVYQHFGAPLNWDFHKPNGAQYGGTRIIVCDKEGNVQTEAAARQAAADAGETYIPRFQTVRRRTLRTLPLRMGYDYSVDPPVNENPTSHEAPFLKPLVWLWKADLDAVNRWVPAHEEGITVHGAGLDWGVELEVKPNHLLALNHFGGAVPSADSNVVPIYDHEDIIATIAIEIDTRLRMEYEIPAGLADPDGSTKVIEVPDAELWWLAPNTVVGINDYGVRKRAPTGRVLRADTGRLALVMAGAIARYYEARVAAEILAAGLVPWTELIGHILTIVEEGGDLHHIEAPITSVQYITGGDGPKTRIRTGFAGPK